MSASLFSIREIIPEDNPKLESIIKSIFPEFGLPTVGTTYEDKETPMMYESYQSEKEVYYVALENGEVIGGAGIKPLQDENPDICELQKMYFKPSARGKGYGRRIFNQCLNAAKLMGYKKCYLESASQLKAAISLYEKNGFVRLNKPMGNTGHYACGVWMIKDL